jgi:hypothetical protein
LSSGVVTPKNNNIHKNSDFSHFSQVSMVLLHSRQHVSSSRKNINMSQIVPDLFSIYSFGKADRTLFQTSYDKMTAIMARRDDRLI